MAKKDQAELTALTAAKNDLAITTIVKRLEILEAVSGGRTDRLSTRVKNLETNEGENGSSIGTVFEEISRLKSQVKKLRRRVKELEP